MAISSLNNRLFQVPGSEDAPLGQTSPSGANILQSRGGGFSGESTFTAAQPAFVPPGGIDGPTGPGAVTAPSVDPANFQNGHIYFRQHGSNTYTEVFPDQVPPGSLLYVNGIGSSTGKDITSYIDSIQNNNPGKDIYTVYNQTPQLHALDIKSLNDNPGNPSSGNPGYYPQVNSLKAILEDTGGDVTVMAHSMGMPLAVSAMTQYHNEHGDLHNTKLYAWGGVANSGNVDNVSNWGAHVVNFVHESKYSFGGAVQTQRGDDVTKDIGGPLDGGNWFQDGTLFEPHSNDSHNVGIDYNNADGWSFSNLGHDYVGQIGNTLGK